LDYFLDKKILFETVAYCPEYFTKGNKEVLFYVSSPEFVKQILSKSRGGYLLDISHNYVSGQSKIKAGEYKGTIEDYFADLLRVCANETYQLHLNVPLFSSQKGYTDGHGLLKPREKLSKQILLIAKEILDSCPNMKVITLEMNSGLEAKMHAKEMVKQAKIVEKELLHK
jgi:hypothetical protein